VAVRTGRILPITTRFVNPFMRRVAAWMPGYAILSYRGRTSGRTYRIPMNVFRDGEDYVIALTYGPDVQWLANVMAAGEGQVRVRRTTVTVGNPRLIADPSGSMIPAYVRPFMRALGVTDYVRLTPASRAEAATPA
jgi:deazaflavin-dependent oxidoreductase (nitroreductase family)